MQQTLASNREDVEHFGRGKNTREEFSMTLDGARGTVLAADGRLRRALSVVVVLRKFEGELTVFSAYLGSEAR